MGSVDDRVVSMKFDNQSFEKNAGSTLGTLDKLKKSLDFSSQSKGLQELSNSTRGFSLEGIGSAVENVSSKFSAMGVVAFTVLNQITTMAISSGTRIVKALSLDGLTDGFQEYETNMRSIQTILSNTRSDGTTLQDVNKALDEMNEYSDKTIYNFGEMARNVGTFTAAGVDLETSTGAIKGIANLAAISGSSSEQAATAMYQLSQALAAGTVKLMDWNSVVNAGMGGEVFQKALFETGKSLGKIKGAGIGTTFEQWTKAGNSFRYSLEDGWLTSEVLIKTLKGFTGDLNEEQLRAMGYTAEQAKEFMALGEAGKAAATDVKTLTQLMSTIKESIGSGWAQTFRVVVGDFEEAKALFGGLYQIASGFIGRAADARNEMLKSWKDMKGRDSLIQGFRNALWAIASLGGTISKAFRDVFPKMTAERLLDLTHQFEALMKALIPGPETLEKLGRIFKGVFSVLGIGWEVVKQTIGVFKDLFVSFGEANGSGILDYFANLGDKVFELKKALVDGGGIKKFFEEYIKPIANFIGSIDISGKIGAIIDAFNRLKNTLAEIFGIDSIKSMDDMADSSNRLTERWSWLIKVGEALGNFYDWIKGKLHEAGQWFTGLFDEVENSFRSGDYSGVFDALNTGLFAGLLLMLKKFLSNNSLAFGKEFLQNLSKTFEQLTGVLSAMQTNLKAEALLKIAIALGVLTASILVLSTIDSAAITKSLGALAVGIGELVGAMALINKASSGPKSAITFDAIAAGLIALSIGVLILTAAVKVLASMDPMQLTAGLTALGALLGEVIIAFKNMPNPSGIIGTGIGLVFLAGGLTVLSLAVKVLGEMPIEQMIGGLIGVGLALTAITVAVKNMPPGMPAMGVGLIGIGIGLAAVTASIKILGELPIEQMLGGLLGVALALTAVTVAVKNMPPGMPAMALGMVGIGIALVIMSQAVKMLADMDLEKMLQGLGGIAATLLVVVLAANAMNGAIAGAVAMLVMAGALVVLGEALKIFDKLGIGSVLLALLGIAVVVGVIAIGSLLLVEAIPIIAAMGAALLAFGIGLSAVGLAALLFGAGIYLVAAAISILASVGMEGAKVFVEMIPIFMTALGKGIVGLVLEILKGLPSIVGAVGELLGALLDLLEEYIPRILEVIGKLILALADFLKENAPRLIEAGMTLLLDFLKGIKDNIYRITTLVAEIITEFLKALSEKIQPLVDAGLQLLTNFLNGIANNIQMVIDAAFNLLTAFINAMGSNMQRVIDSGGDLVSNIITGIGNNINKVVTAGGEMVLSIMQGISDNILKVINGGADILVKFLNGLADAIRTKGPEIREAGKNIARAIIDGIVDGIKDLGGLAIEGIKGLAGGMIDGVKGVFGIDSPSKVMYQMAGYLSEGLVRGLGNDKSATHAANMFSRNVVDVMNSSIAKVSSIIEGMDEFNPTITPVLDLTNVEQGANKLNTMLPDASIDASVSYGQAASLAFATRQQEKPPEENTPQAPVVRDIKFEQTINSPTALSVRDIYRQNKSQFAIATKELVK